MAPAAIRPRSAARSGMKRRQCATCSNADDDSLAARIVRASAAFIAHGLLKQNVDARVQRRKGLRGVQGIGRAHYDGVKLTICDERVEGRVLPAEYHRRRQSAPLTADGG